MSEKRVLILEKTNKNHWSFFFGKTKIIQNSLSYIIYNIFQRKAKLFLTCGL